MSKKIEKIFNKCINLIEKGYSIEYCLERYSGYREELEEYFDAAKELGKIREVKPDSEYMNASLKKIYASSVEAPEVKVPETGRVRMGPAILKPALIFLAVFILASFSFVGTAYAAQDSIPGEVLYPVKRSAESIKLMVYPESMKGSLHYQFLNNRISEADILLETSESPDDEVIGKLLEEADGEFRECRRYGYFNGHSEQNIEETMKRVRQKYQNRCMEKHEQKNGAEEGKTQNGSEYFQEENNFRNGEKNYMDETGGSSSGNQNNMDNQHEQKEYEQQN